MNPLDPNDPAPSEPPRAPPPVFAAPPAATAASPLHTPYENVLEQFARAYLRDRRSERRWRVFFRLAWLAVIVALLWGGFAQRNRAAAPSGPHTALIELQGEIAAESDTNAENIVAGLKSAFEDMGAQPGGCLHLPHRSQP